MDVLRSAEVSRPIAGAGGVLVRVRAAGLDRGTWHVMTGTPYALRLAFGLRAPKNPVLGRAVAGTVAAIGAGVTRFSPGDEVFGIAPGSFADYAVAKEGKLALKPTTIDFEHAAVSPVSGLTALQALDAGGVEAGQHVLVLGASGGVGSFAVQLAKASGAEVTAVCSAAKADLVRALGADHVLDYAHDDFADGTRHYDLILDVAGRPSPTRLRRALTPRGTAVIVGGEDGGPLTGGMGRQLRARALSLVGRQRLTSVLCKERSEDLVRLAELIDAGRAMPSVGRVYPLTQAVDAMRHLVAGDVRGTTAITVAS